MNFVTRAINLITQPKAELSRASAEPATIGGLVFGYALILAALPAIGSLLSSIIHSGGGMSDWIVRELIFSVLMFVVRDLGLTILIGIIAAALAPNFGGRKDNVSGVKMAVYAATPIWLLAFLGALLVPIVPELNYLFLIIGFGYAGFLIYLSCGPMLGVPEAQAPAFTGVVTIIWLVLYFLVNALLTRIIYSGFYYRRV